MSPFLEIQGLTTEALGSNSGAISWRSRPEGTKKQRWKEKKVHLPRNLARSGEGQAGLEGACVFGADRLEKAGRSRQRGAGLGGGEGENLSEWTRGQQHGVRGQGCDTFSMEHSQGNPRATARPLTCPGIKGARCPSKPSEFVGIFRALCGARPASGVSLGKGGGILRGGRHKCVSKREEGEMVKLAEGSGRRGDA